MVFLQNTLDYACPWTVPDKNVVGPVLDAVRGFGGFPSVYNWHPDLRYYRGIPSLLNLKGGTKFVWDKFRSNLSSLCQERVIHFLITNIVY